MTGQPQQIDESNLSVDNEGRCQSKLSRDKYIRHYSAAAAVVFSAAVVPMNYNAAAAAAAVAAWFAALSVQHLAPSGR